MLASLGDNQIGEVAGFVAAIKLLGENTVPAGAAGAGRARQTEDDGGIGQPGQAATLDR